MKEVCSEGHHGEVVNSSGFLRRQILIVDPDFHAESDPRLTGARDEEAYGFGQEAAQANLIDRLIHSSSY
jgi:hypothetical protein